MDTSRISARDSALLRLRRLTAVSVAGAGALALAFAGLAARTFSGHTATHAVSRRVAPAPHGAPTQTAPPLVAAQAAAPAPAPAQSAPVQTAAPPIVVSGGS